MKRIPRRLFTEEFKREAIKLVTEQHLNVAAAGRKLDVDPKSIRSWITGSERGELKATLGATKLTADQQRYGLHRARDESFFKGEKIIALRKCVGEPKFTYTDFDCYVSATFYVIKTDRLNQKYLTALLNSKLIAFWLRHKGKMQGNNFQIDKEPLLMIPIFLPSKEQSAVIEKVVSEILSGKANNKTTSHLESKIDSFVYRLYILTFNEVKVIDPDYVLSEAEYNAIVI